MLKENNLHLGDTINLANSNLILSIKSESLLKVLYILIMSVLHLVVVVQILVLVKLIITHTC